MGILVHRRADAVAAELHVDRVTGSAEHRADSVGDIADLVARSSRFDSRGQRPFGGVDHRETLGGLVLTHDETDGRVRGDAAEDHGQVQRQQIAVGQRVVVGKAMQHSIVDGGADVVTERTATEGRRVVDVAGRRPGSLDDLFGPLIDLEQIGADCGAFADGSENPSYQAPDSRARGILVGGRISIMWCLSPDDEQRYRYKYWCRVRRCAES